MDFEWLKYSTAIGLKIVPNIKCPQLQITMNQCFVSTHQDGSNMLKTLMEMHIPSIHKPHMPSAYVEQTAQPTFKLKSNPYMFQKDLNLYYQTKKSYDKTYLDMKKPNVFLGAIKNDTRYTNAILNVINLLPQDINADIPPQYRLGHIADTICNHSSVEKGVRLNAFYGEATQPYIKYTETPYNDTEAAMYCVNGKEK